MYLFLKLVNNESHSLQFDIQGTNKTVQFTT